MAAAPLPVLLLEVRNGGNVAGSTRGLVYTYKQVVIMRREAMLTEAGGCRILEHCYGQCTPVHD